MKIRGENVSWQQGCCWAFEIWRHQNYGSTVTEKLWQYRTITFNEMS